MFEKKPKLTIDMSGTKQPKLKMSAEDVLKLTAEMMGNFKEMIEKQDKKIELLIETVKQTKEIQSDVKSIRENQGSQGQDYIFFLNMVIDMAQMKSLYGSDEQIKVRLDVFKTKLEVIMKEYKIQELRCNFLKKL